ncbi:MAG TPA: energy transducer TonB [Candidatus Dormibacteraeota bacterium]|jgi:protein TonB|nr:energy transducer TonB [Candidatus Dormibacteraeota bacterium]
MSELEFKTIAPKAERDFLAEPHGRVPARPSEDPKQRGLMLGSLCILLLALGIALWHERDFWFPDTDTATEAESEQPVESMPASDVRVQPPAPAAVAKLAPSAKSKHEATKQTKALAITTPTSPTSAPVTPPPPVAVTRTVLPPLEVEVVAGDTHRTIRPGTSSVRVNLQPGTTTEPQANVGAVVETQTAANVTSDAADRMQISADASDILARPVKPSYPLLARQMKVQGSVILQAMIGRDGIIQNLRLVSGPHILASAAEDAVRQWHFKPHLQDNEPVETQAKITVNFTISTN